VRRPPGLVAAMLASAYLGTALVPMPAHANPHWTPARIEVFVQGGSDPVNAQRATIHRMDALHQLTTELNAGPLPAHKDQAVRIVRQRIQAMGPTFKSRMESALRAVEAAAIYGVQGTPAVVFDGSRVVYGVTDVTQAVEIVRRGGGQAIRQRFIAGRSSPAPLPPTSAQRSSP
jgi:integrating conjugative element protein (TIGR03757 family)